jgi:uncharacterized protein YjiS (DUF1127 family)
MYNNEINNELYQLKIKRIREELQKMDEEKLLAELKKRFHKSIVLQELFSRNLTNDEMMEIIEYVASLSSKKLEGKLRNFIEKRLETYCTEKDFLTLLRVVQKMEGAKDLKERIIKMLLERPLDNAIYRELMYITSDQETIEKIAQILLQNPSNEDLFAIAVRSEFFKTEALKLYLPRMDLEDAIFLMDILPGNYQEIIFEEKKDLIKKLTIKELEEIAETTSSPKIARKIQKWIERKRLIKKLRIKIEKKEGQ